MWASCGDGALPRRRGRVGQHVSAFCRSQYLLVWQIMALVPPIGSSVCFCFLVSICSAARSMCRRRRRKAEEYAGASFGSDSDASSVGLTIEEPGDTAWFPLALSSIIVSSLTMLEGFAPLYVLLLLNWWKALTVGIVLKLYVWEICVFWGECVMQSQCFAANERLGLFGRTLQLWVRSSRMSRDIAASSMILGILMPFVVLNTFNEYLCPGCSAHQLLIYRAPNVQQPLEDVGDEEHEYGSEGSILSMDSDHCLA